MSERSCIVRGITIGDIMGIRKAIKSFFASQLSYDIIEGIVFLVCAVAISLFVAFCLGAIGCSEHPDRTPPPGQATEDPNAQPTHPKSGFTIDGVVRKKYMLNGEKLLKIENFDGRTIVIHSEKFYEKYNEGDRIRLTANYSGG